MNLKHLLFTLFIVFFVFAVVNTATAVDNVTDIVNDAPNDVSIPGVDVNQPNNDISQSTIDTCQSDIEISQSYDPQIVYKGDWVNVYISFKNNGNSTVHDLIVYYNLPKEFDFLIYPSEFENGTFSIDSIYPGELIKYTFICKALVSNVTAVFGVSLDGSTFIPLDIYVQPDNNNNQSNQSDINDDGCKINTDPVNLQPTGNPLALLLLGLLSIPLFIYKRH